MAESTLESDVVVSSVVAMMDELLYRVLFDLVESERRVSHVVNREMAGR